MPPIIRLKCVGPQPSDNDNRITIEYHDVVYSVNQRFLKRYQTTADLLAALTKFLGYEPDDVFPHINRDGTWAIAIGTKPPAVWPEDDDDFPIDPPDPV